MGKPPPPKSFHKQLRELEELQYKLSLWFVIFGLAVMVMLLLSIIMDHRPADCPKIPKSMFLHIPLDGPAALSLDGGQPSLSMLYQAVEGANLDLFRVSTSHLLNWTQAQVSVFDTKQSDLARHSLSLSAMTASEEFGIRHRFCEYSTNLCPASSTFTGTRHAPVVHLLSNVTSVLYQQCLSLFARGLVLDNLDDLQSSFPAFKPINFFAGTTPLKLERKLITRQARIGRVTSVLTSHISQHFDVSIMLVSDSVAPQRSHASLVVHGELIDPYTQAFEVQVLELRRELLVKLHSLKLVGNVNGGNPSKMDDNLRAKFVAEILGWTTF